MRHTRGILTRETGAMTRVNPLAAGLMAQAMASRRHVGGQRTVLNQDVWDRLSPKAKARVEACLADAAEQLKCSKSDLLWSMDRRGVVSIKKREQICLTTS